jgi:hypothetical protein
MDALTALLLLAALGAYHGINPGMGWLFAVALGLQERSRAAVLRALGPIALGHAASIAAIILLFTTAETFVPIDVLRMLGGVILVAFGVYKLLAPFSHPRWVGMRVTGRDLATWSFLMASAHGAGLMLIPLLVRSDSPSVVAAHGPHAGHTSYVVSQPEASPASIAWFSDLLRVGVHTAVMFAVMALIAVIVYEKVGLAVLRRAWFNLDRVWAVTLISAGVLTVAR